MSDRTAKESSQADEVLTLFRRGAESASQLLRENEQLRQQIAELEKGELAQVSAPENGEPFDEARATIQATSRSPGRMNSF